MFGLTFKRKFPGTLFRFALRTPEQAETSEISRVVYDDTKMRAVVAAFEESAAEALLFLRNVESVEIYIWNDGEPAAALVHSTKVANMNSKLRKDRDGMQRLPRPLQLKTIRSPEQYTTTIILDIVGKQHASLTTLSTAFLPENLVLEGTGGLLGRFPKNPFKGGDDDDAVR